MADVKITELPELTTVSDADIVPVVDDVAGTPTTKKITKANLLDGDTHVRATRDSVQSIAHGAYTVIIFDDEEYDALGEYNAATGVFTATVAGYYLLSGGCSCASTAFALGDFWWVCPFKNSTHIGAGDVDRSGDAGAANRYSYTTTVVHLSIGDTLSLKVYHNQGGAVNIRDDAGYEFNFITIDRLR